MKGAMLITRLFLICLMIQKRSCKPGEPGVVQSSCGDSHLWIKVSSSQTPQFEAVDVNGVHFISSEVAARCGYTISSSSFRASYYSCFTHNQKDEVFTFRFNVLLPDGGNNRSNTNVSLSAVCEAPVWTDREILCEENYMEVNLKSGDWCGQRVRKEEPTLAHPQEEEHSSSYQLMFLRSDLQVLFMSLTEGQRRGFTLSITNQRTVFRSVYSQPQAKVEEVGGVSVEALRVFLVYRQKLMTMMMDMSVSCPDAVGWENQGVGVGLESQMLDQGQMVSRGLSLIQDGEWTRIRIPFGAEGGHRTSLVENNTYKERFRVLLQYHHTFSLLYDYGSITTRHRTFQVLDSALVCRTAYTLNNTLWQQHVFTVFLGNVPADVKLQEVTINGMTSAGFRLRPLPQTNGSQSFELRVPFDHHAVHWTYVGGGVVEYSILINYTLTMVDQPQSYYHHTTITARALDAFPPEITAQCSDMGVSFSVVPAPHAASMWEVGVQHHPLTPELVHTRGYTLYQDHNRTTLEVPTFSVGFTYDGINLSSFYGTFQLLLRDSRSLEVQTSTTKRCLFRTRDMIVCSANGTVTLVTTLTGAWPLVPAHRTRLLDPSCGPKQAQGDRVLFEFKLDSCGTRTTRQLISDGPNVISRESEFRMTARCFYPLGSVLRMFVDQSFTSDGYGLISKDAGSPPPSGDCPHQGPGFPPSGTPQAHSDLLTADWSLDVNTHHLPQFEDVTRPSEEVKNLRTYHSSPLRSHTRTQQEHSSHQTRNQHFEPVQDNSVHTDQMEPETSSFSSLVTKHGHHIKLLHPQQKQ
ncbi:uncharacterized protein LOC114458327 [Gouania willdenowi]|uniref:uncharacterized protein LOC114458327 n=1 Tax=Gouania willdenowi TaxID=441366 RepID=UPI001056741D|nr:uncharacterized protein LOC114458327 [Gouania willdenowi]